MATWNLPAPPAPTAFNQFPPSSTPPAVFLTQALGSRGGHWEAGGLYIEYVDCGLTISYAWQPAFSATTDGEGHIQQVVTVMTGVTNSESEISTFTESLTVGASSTLEGLGLSISGTISESLSDTYTQTFTSSTQTSQTLSFTPSAQTEGWWWQAVQILEYTYSTYTRIAGDQQGKTSPPTTLTLNNLLPVIWFQQYPELSS